MLGFELGRMFAPNGEIFDADTVQGLMDIPELKGIKHSSLDRLVELERLALRDARRPDFRIYTGNDLGINMIEYGSDYLLGLATFAPEKFAERDRLWKTGDPCVLRALGCSAVSGKRGFPRACSSLQAFGGGFSALDRQNSIEADSSQKSGDDPYGNRKYCGLARNVSDSSDSGRKLHSEPVLADIFSRKVQRRTHYNLMRLGEYAVFVRRRERPYRHVEFRDGASSLATAAVSLPNLPGSHNVIVFTVLFSI